MAETRTSVLIVDDHEMVAEALRQALDRTDDLEVVGRAATVADAVFVVLERKPRVVLMDFHLPDGTGADATREILARAPDIVVVMLTGSADADTAAAGLEAGCSGFVSKDASVSELVRAIRHVVAGEVVVPPELLPALVARTRPGRPSLGDDLTDREREVLGMLAAGKSTDDIVNELFLSTHTVRNHIRNILTKLDAHSRLEAVAVAGRLGLVDVGT